MVVWLMIATRCDHSSICVEPITSVQEIPSNTENFGKCSGDMLLFSDNAKEFSFDNITNSAEPLV